MALALRNWDALGEPESVEQVARAMAMELRAVGCNLNFAPMLDLHVNSESPVTKDRSFGSDPHFVAQYGRRPLIADCGREACFRAPNIFRDMATRRSILIWTCRVFDGTMDRLDSSELIPFAAAVAAGVPTGDDRAHPAAPNRSRKSRFAFAQCLTAFFGAA